MCIAGTFLEKGYNTSTITSIIVEPHCTVYRIIRVHISSPSHEAMLAAARGGCMGLTKSLVLFSMDEAWWAWRYIMAGEPEAG